MSGSPRWSRKYFSWLSSKRWPRAIFWLSWPDINFVPILLLMDRIHTVSVVSSIVALGWHGHLLSELAIASIHCSISILIALISFHEVSLELIFLLTRWIVSVYLAVGHWALLTCWSCHWTFTCSLCSTISYNTSSRLLFCGLFQFREGALRKIL